MERAQRTRAKSVGQPKSQDARILEALKKASEEARRKAVTDGVPFIVCNRKSWSMPK